MNENSALSEKVRTALASSGDDLFELEEVAQLSEGLERLRRDNAKVAAILLNPFLPDSQGIATVKSLLYVAANVPILILGEEDQEALAVEAVECGAQDYLLPNHIDRYSLPRALRNAVERKSIEDALYVEKDRALVTLNSIGDAVLCTDLSGKIIFLNLVAEALTGWKRDEALGKPLAEVFVIIDGETRQPAADPLKKAIEQNRAVSIASNSLLLRRGGGEATIEDSSAPIHDRSGAVIGAVIVFHDVSVARAMTIEMTYAAHHDAVTALPNRLLLNDRISHAITTAQRHKQKFAVMFVDLDHFKSINDSLGHAVGDKLLQAVAKRLQASVRASDTVGRHGGDEFIVLLPEIEEENDSEISAKKILAALSEPFLFDDVTLQITATIGISIYPRDGKDANSLIQNADLAMYEAKENGRDQVHFFSDEMKLQAIERQFVESGLRRALEQNEFLLYYQPKVNLKSGKITGAEALIRWQEPHRGLLLPDQFIRVAENRGLIIPIGRWVLHEVCRQARLWELTSGVVLPISINVSEAELRDTDFIQGVRAALAETGLTPRSIQFELTEGILLKDLRTSIAVLNELKLMGIHMAVDDFGTGYSSLSYLHQFAINVLKIDKSFVHLLTADPRNSTLICAIIAMAKGLKYRVIAEGVETETQRDFLQKQGCEEGQGYLFSKPLPAAEFRELIHK
ncbi:putative bifunctional diguanylate cyclase/phosphodiesterase [Terriglobus saanensis]|nr:EAL domain-containing protein [Terriglobus saanensis]